MVPERSHLLGSLPAVARPVPGRGDGPYPQVVRSQKVNGSSGI